MQSQPTRPIDLADVLRRHEMPRVVAAALPRSGIATEVLALYLVVATFWAVILYAALTFALP